MAENENVALVQNFYSNVQAGNLDAVLALLTLDFKLLYAGPSVIPAAGTWNGHQGFLAWAHAALAGHLPPESLTFDEFMTYGDRVVVPGHVELRIKTTRKTCATDFLHVFTVRDGKLAGWRDFYDTFALAQAYMR